MGAENRQPCPTCGLWDPCKTCGGGARPKLAAVAGGYSRDEVLTLMRKSFALGQQHPKLCAEAPEVTGSFLKELLQ